MAGHHVSNSVDAKSRMSHPGAESFSSSIRLIFFTVFFPSPFKLLVGLPMHEKI
jgi:hypothetical protein